MKNFYITTPIYYPSGRLHLGHVYSTVSADVLKRIKQQQGYEVLFLTGTDEHGEKIETKAFESGKTPQEYVDEMSEEIKKMWKIMDVDYDIFSRTTDEFHVKQVQSIFTKLLNQGDVYLGDYEGLYCVSCETYVTKSQILIEEKCPDCNGNLKLVTEEVYKFKCSKYSNTIMGMIQNDKIVIEPESRKNELLNSFFVNGIPDLAISRTNFTWGIPIKENDNHVIYVWLDALTNYITMLEKYDKENFWPSGVQLMGKEIIRFHAIYWPMILLALGKEMPTKMFAHGWLLVDGDKMSKSKKNVIYPEFLVENYGSDAVRYFLLKEIPFGKDGVFTPATFIGRYNSELVNEFSNLVNRSVVMANKYFNGYVEKGIAENEYVDDLQKSLKKVQVLRETYIEKLEFSKDLDNIWDYIHLTNKFIDLTTPWILAKDTMLMKELEVVMFTLLNSIIEIGKMIEPYMPNTGKIIRKAITKNEKGINVPVKMEIIFSRLNEEEEIQKIYGSMK